MAGVRTTEKAEMQEGCSGEGFFSGRSLGERAGFWDSKRDAWTEVCSVVRVQKGMVGEGSLSI